MSNLVKPAKMRKLILSLCVLLPMAFARAQTPTPTPSLSQLHSVMLVDSSLPSNNPRKWYTWTNQTGHTLRVVKVYSFVELMTAGFTSWNVMVRLDPPDATEVNNLLLVDYARAYEKNVFQKREEIFTPDASYFVPQGASIYSYTNAFGPNGAGQFITVVFLQYVYSD